MSIHDTGLTLKRLGDEPLEVVHVFWVFCLGVAEDVPAWKPRRSTET